MAVVQRSAPSRRMTGMGMIEGRPLVAMVKVLLVLAPVGRFSKRSHTMDQPPVGHPPIPHKTART